MWKLISDKINYKLNYITVHIRERILHLCFTFQITKPIRHAHKISLKSCENLRRPRKSVGKNKKHKRPSVTVSVACGWRCREPLVAQASEDERKENVWNHCSPMQWLKFFRNRSKLFLIFLELATIKAVKSLILGMARMENCCHWRALCSETSFFDALS